MKKQCIASNCQLLSNPLQYQCVKCGQTWLSENYVPLCKEPNKKDIEQEIMEMFDKEFPFGSFAGCSIRANEVKSFIYHIITIVRKMEREEMVEKLIEIEEWKRRGGMHPMWNKAKTNTIQELKSWGKGDNLIKQND